MTEEVIVAGLTAIGVFGAIVFFGVCAVTAIARCFDDDVKEEEEDNRNVRP